MELSDLSAMEITGLVKSKKASAVEVLQSCLERIGQVDGRPGSLSSTGQLDADRANVHAFITRTDDQALAAARQVDMAVAKGEEVGLLAGVPYTVKDIFCTQGVQTTAASRILEGFIPPYTATCVSRMAAAGALMLGKVNLDEFTYGSSTESTAYKPATRNPWDTSCVPGGSSGGSTAAVAAGEGALSLGTDTAGSIRQPAAFCGVVGLKPTYGRVSRYGVIAFASSIDCPGPIGRNVTDTAAMLQVIAGEDARDSTAAKTPVDDYLAGLEKGVKGMRIGLSPDYFMITYPDPQTGELVEQALPDEITAPVREAAQLLRSLGAEVVEDVPMPHNRYGIPAYFVISRVEAASNLHRFDGVKYGHRTREQVEDLHAMYRRSRAEGFGLQPKLRVLMGMYVSAAQYSEQYYNRALRVRSLIRRDFDDIFDPAGKYRLNALLTPTTPTPAFKMDAVYGDSVLMQYADQLTVAANHAGIPGLSIPAGLSESGLPLAIQLLGPDFSEAALLRIGRSYEQVTADAAWRKVKPQVLR